MEDNKYRKDSLGKREGGAGRWRKLFFAACWLIGGGIGFSALAAVATLAKMSITPNPSKVFALMKQPAWSHPVSTVPFPHM